MLNPSKHDTSPQYCTLSFTLAAPPTLGAPPIIGLKDAVEKLWPLAARVLPLLGYEEYAASAESAIRSQVLSRLEKFFLNERSSRTFAVAPVGCAVVDGVLRCPSALGSKSRLRFSLFLPCISELRPHHTSKSRGLSIVPRRCLPPRIVGLFWRIAGMSCHPL